MMFLPICIRTGVEYWIESDMEIDEDIQIEEANVPPPDVSLVQESPEKAELNIIVRWTICFPFFKHSSSLPIGHSNGC